MDGYIVDPRTVYWIGVLGSVKTVMVVLAVLSGMAISGLVCGLFYNAEWLDHFADNKRYYKICKTGTIILIPIFIITSIAAVFIPKEKVMIEMMVASLATRENLQMTTDGIKELVDYVVNVMATLK